MATSLDSFSTSTAEGRSDSVTTSTLPDTPVRAPLPAELEAWFKLFQQLMEDWWFVSVLNRSVSSRISTQQNTPLTVCILAFLLDHSRESVDRGRDLQRSSGFFHPAPKSSQSRA